jgi:hypothetical protein
MICVQFIYIAVGEYIPMVIYKKPKQEFKFIDDCIRKGMYILI